MMNDPVFQRQAITEWKQRPAKGPYTLALGNSAVYLSLPYLYPAYSTITSAIRAQVADGSASNYAAPDSHSTVIEGYNAQLRVLASSFENPEKPILEAPFNGGLPGSGFLLHPLSRGTVKLNLSDHDADPVLDYRSASNPLDVEVMATFLPFWRRFYNQSTVMNEIGARESSPGPSVQTQDEIRAHVRSSMTASFQHPCCTAAMMPKSKGGVVGSDLLVHGLTGLSIADLSIIPLLVSSHTSSTAYAVGEKVKYDALSK
jgi:choline dehydrogenase